MTLLTRRETTGLLLASAGVAIAPTHAIGETEESLAFKLAEALNGRLQRGCGGTFAVPKFQLGGTRRKVVMQSAILLNWPAGQRCRAFRSTGGNQQEAIVAMFQDGLREFGKAWPQCVRV